jgi:hypothetical protein
MDTSQNPFRKITFKIWKPVKDQLDSRMDWLRRDAYLAKVLAVELDNLEQEVSIPNSDEACRYVHRAFNKLESVPMGLALPQELVLRLDDICSRKKIYRDAFLNRLLLLLVAGPKTIEALLFPNVEGDWREDLWRHCQRNGTSLTRGFYPLDTAVDPFWAFREALAVYVLEGETTYERTEPSSGKIVRVRREFLDSAPEPADSLYTRVFDQKAGGNSLIGLSCYLPDRLIPDSPAAKEHKTKLDELFEML